MAVGKAGKTENAVEGVKAFIEKWPPLLFNWSLIRVRTRVRIT